MRYLKQHHKVLYYNLLINGYLADIDKQSEDMFFGLVKQIAEREGVTEQFKSTDQILWVQKMNNIHNRAPEKVRAKIIYML